MKKIIASILGATLAFASISCAGHSKSEASETDSINADSVPTVYYIKDITPESLVKVYQALERQAEGNKIGIKISTGESNKSNHLDTALIAPLVRMIGGNFIEGNTAYAGNRNSTEKHYQTAKEHGFVDLAGVDIMDGEGTVELPVVGGKHLTKDIVGKTFPEYDYIVVLSHFKGHQMGGFGGALKNISIGIASSEGKTYIHTGGLTANPDSIWGNTAEQLVFIESMADAAKAITDHAGDRILYINVANRLSVDCDCNGNPAEPHMGDLGIFASIDPVALDRACVDAVLNSDDPGKEELIERIRSRQGEHILEAAEELGIGSQKYRLVTIE